MSFKWSFTSSLFLSPAHEGSERLQCTSLPKYISRACCHYRLDGNLSRPQKTFWTEDHKTKFSLPTGNQISTLRTSSPKPRLYTNWATRLLRRGGSKICCVNFTTWYPSYHEWSHTDKSLYLLTNYIIMKQITSAIKLVSPFVSTNDISCLRSQPLLNVFIA